MPAKDHPSKIPSDTHRLAKYWGSCYAADIEASSTSPSELSIAVVGHESDGMMVDCESNMSPMEHLAWAATYVGYPCDAVWVTVNYRITDGAILNYTHLVPTNESLVLLIAKAKGKWRSKVLDDAEHLDFFEPVRSACHEYDNMPIEDGEADARRMARDLVEQAEWPVVWLPAASIIDAAREATAQ